MKRLLTMELSVEEEINVDVRGDMQSCGGRVYIPLSSKVESFRRSMQAGFGSIYRVQSHLRKVKAEAYEPEIIAIGPYHHGKEKLAMMEKHKVRYLDNFLRRVGGNVDKYIEAIRQHEKVVSNFYADSSSSLASYELVDMMVLDGCFIIELVLKYALEDLREQNDPIFKTDWMRNSLRRDLMLFENQLPFIVLLELLRMVVNATNDQRADELFSMVEMTPRGQKFDELLLDFFKGILPFPGPRWSSAPECSLETVKHLLDFVHINWRPPPFEGNEEIHNCESDSNRKSLIMRSATELREAGVEFEKVKGNHFFDIRFIYGTLKIPTIEINNTTEAFLKNLIALEQYTECTNKEKFVTAYTWFMVDYLINSPKDVEILRRHGIIDNMLDDDGIVSDIFNKIRDSVTGSIGRYAQIAEQLNSHCSKRRNRWMAILRHNILNSPWAMISVTLFVLTVLQTTFTVFPGN